MSEKTASPPEKTRAETGGRTPPPRPAPARGAASLLDLQRSAGNQETARLLRTSLGLVQPKLQIGPPGDAYEREADRVADTVLGRPAAPVSISAVSGSVQRRYAKCEGECHCQGEKDLVQPKEAPDGTVPSTPSFEAKVEALRGRGEPLSPAARSFFEPRFGQDFGAVRVHTSTTAHDAAQAVNARAFTLGHDVVFGAGEYSPETSSGQHLLAHELTHVVQQTGESAPRIQRSLLSTFLDVVLFIPRLFGLEVFPAEDLREYLDGLRKRKGPEKGLFSDNKARACVSREKELGPYDTQTKVGLVEDMLDGWTTFLDEGAIIALLRRSEDRQRVVSQIGRDRLWSNFSGENRRIIEAITLTAADAGDALVARLRDLQPSEIQDFAANAKDPAVLDAARRAAALARMTAPVPTEAAITPAGEANFTINGVQLTVLPDQINPTLGKHAFTNAEFSWIPPAKVEITPENAQIPMGEIPALSVSVKIWTEFPSEASKSERAGYGVGTRPQDKPTLRYHERGHGEAWLNFLRDNPPPAFTGKSGMLPAEFNAAVDQWTAAREDYQRRAGEYSMRTTDCVGTLPTDEQLEGTGFIAAICHPQP